MLSYSELKKGVKIVLDKDPYEIIEASFLFKGRGHSVLQTKIKNLITGNIISRTFHPSDNFEEAEISKIKAKFIYSHRDKLVFSKKDNFSERFELTEEQVGSAFRFLKPNQIIESLIFKEKIINISLPIKIELKVTESPPGVRGQRAEPGTKTVVLETGAKINVPLFVKEGNIVEVNTQTGEYVKRIE